MVVPADTQRSVRERPIHENDRLLVWWEDDDPPEAFRKVDGGKLWNNLKEAREDAIMQEQKMVSRRQKVKRKVTVSKAHVHTPGVRHISNYHLNKQALKLPKDGDHQTGFHMSPSSPYVRHQGFKALFYGRPPQYDADSEDEAWLEEFNAQAPQTSKRPKQVRVTVDVLENIIEALEHMHQSRAVEWWQKRVGLSQEGEVNPRLRAPPVESLVPSSDALPLGPDPVVAKAVYQHWAKRRKAEPHRGPLLPHLWFTQPWKWLCYGGSGNANEDEDERSHIPFAGDETLSPQVGGSIRLKKLSRAEAVQVLAEIREELEQARTLCDRVKKREKLKKQLVEAWKDEILRQVRIHQLEQALNPSMEEKPHDNSPGGVPVAEVRVASPMPPSPSHTSSPPTSPTSPLAGLDMAPTTGKKPLNNANEESTLVSGRKMIDRRKEIDGVVGTHRLTEKPGVNAPLSARHPEQQGMQQKQKVAMKQGARVNTGRVKVLAALSGPSRRLDGHLTGIAEDNGTATGACQDASAPPPQKRLRCGDNGTYANGGIAIKGSIQRTEKQTDLKDQRELDRSQGNPDRINACMPRKRMRVEPGCGMSKGLNGKSRDRSALLDYAALQQFASSEKMTEQPRCLHDKGGRNGRSHNLSGARTLLTVEDQQNCVERKGVRRSDPLDRGKLDDVGVNGSTERRRTCQAHERPIRASEQAALNSRKPANPATVRQPLSSREVLQLRRGSLHDVDLKAIQTLDEAPDDRRVGGRLKKVRGNDMQPVQEGVRCDHPEGPLNVEKCKGVLGLSRVPQQHLAPPPGQQKSPNKGLVSQGTRHKCSISLSLDPIKDVQERRRASGDELPQAGRATNLSVAGDPRNGKITERRKPGAIPLEEVLHPGTAVPTRNLPNSQTRRGPKRDADGHALGTAEDSLSKLRQNGTARPILGMRTEHSDLNMVNGFARNRSQVEKLGTATRMGAARCAPPRSGRTQEVPNLGPGNLANEQYTSKLRGHSSGLFTRLDKEGLSSKPMQNIVAAGRQLTRPGQKFPDKDDLCPPTIARKEEGTLREGKVEMRKVKGSSGKSTTVGMDIQGRSKAPGSQVVKRPGRPLKTDNCVATKLNLKPAVMKKVGAGPVSSGWGHKGHQLGTSTIINVTVSCGTPLSQQALPAHPGLARRGRAPKLTKDALQGKGTTRGFHRHEGLKGPGKHFKAFGGPFMSTRSHTK